MTAQSKIKVSAILPQTVGIVFSLADLRRALRLRNPPDLFEFRLDRLYAATNELRDALPKLRAPVIITARSPAEGGVNKLPLARRRELLLRFLSNAAYVDVELRCAAAFSTLLNLARRRKVRVILSLHALHTTPTASALASAAHRAYSLGADIFKIATRTDRPEQLNRLLEFLNFAPKRMPISAMGIGKLGRISRKRLAHAGSVLNYAHLGHPTIESQWSLAQLRAALTER
jgi:3-dehydroquinate dehydratase-1